MMGAAMMGQQEEQKDLFSYQVDLDRRVREDNPLRAIKGKIDFTWVREEVKGYYGYNGNVSVDPVVILKLMFLLYYDNVRSERELMRVVPERLDYLWFLGYGLDEEVPDHSVLSKARARWGREIFEKLFVQTVRQCVEEGLVGGKKIHLDGSLVDADASKDSVVKGGEELIAALRQAYGAQEAKLGGSIGAPNYQSVNRKMVSTSDPDAPVVRHNKKGGSGDSRPRYKNHRAVDDEHGVITAVETTPGDVEENSRAEALVEQHEEHTQEKTEVVVADQQYGTVDNYRKLQNRRVRTHMGPIHGGKSARHEGIFPMEKFSYDQTEDVYVCPAGQKLYPRALHPRRQAIVYRTRKGVCDGCRLRSSCTRGKHGRTIMRHYQQELIDRARMQAGSREGRRDRARRRHLAEGSFADAIRHHFKRSRWRRLHNQQIQNHLIAAIQNIKIIIRNTGKEPKRAIQAAIAAFTKTVRAFCDCINAFQPAMARI